MAAKVNLCYNKSMYKNKGVSVVISTYRERGSIRQVIEDFFNTGHVDEIIVVNNNAGPDTDEEIKKTKAKLIHETRQGYGYGYRRGIQEAKGDYIVLCEADNTYAASDIEKFLVFAKNFPAVFGSRTNTSTLLDTKTMQPVRRYVNVIYAKIIEALFGTTTLTDVGCTYKLFHKEVLQALEPHFKTTDSLFATELQLLTASRKVPFVEIPIIFRERVGKSGTILHFGKLVEWAIRIWLFIWIFWGKWQWNKLFPKKTEIS